jgi:hypothetical protein
MIKKILKRMFLNTLVLYPTAYLVKCYIEWDFTHPFQWILNIPTATEDHRKFILGMYVLYVLLNAILSSVYVQEVKENEK